MDDLISRQMAVDALGTPHGIIYPIRTIESLPSAQPEIIRCKDCKHSEHWYKDRQRCFLWNEDGVSVFDDGFCNYGELKQ